jgi:hypothetical protein
MITIIILIIIIVVILKSFAKCSYIGTSHVTKRMLQAWMLKRALLVKEGNYQVKETKRSVRQADPSSRGVLPTVVCHCV